MEPWMELAAFVEELDRVVAKWPDNAVWTVSMVAAYTGASQDEAEVWFSFGLETSLDFQTRLTADQGRHATARLKEAVRDGAHVHRVETRAVAEATTARYQALKSRLRELAAEKDWRRAYKNLSNFVAQEGDRLTFEDQIEALGDCLRYGTKGEVAAGDLVQWIKKGVEVSLIDGSKQGAEDALDFIEAYGDYFVEQGNKLIIETLLTSLDKPIEQFSLGDRRLEVREEVGL